MKKLALNLLKVSTRVYVCFLSYLEGFYSGESLQVFWIWHRTLHNMCSDKKFVATVSHGFRCSEIRQISLNLYQRIGHVNQHALH